MWKNKAHSSPSIRFILISFLIGILLMSTPVPAQVHWEYVVDGPVLSPGDSGEWDAGMVLLPSVIQDGDTFKMWYTGSRGNYLSPEPVEIGYAWSLDGVHWNKYPGNPVLSPRPGEWDAMGVAAPVVLKDGDTLRLWYAGIGEGDNPKIPPAHFGYAWSLDGIHWNRLDHPVLEPGPAGEWDDLICNEGGVIKEDGIFKMYYWGAMYYPGFPPQWPYILAQTGLATSTDGIHWTKYDDPLTTDPPYQFSDPVVKAEPWTATPKPWGQARAMLASVIPTDYGYEMWLSGLHPTQLVPGGYPVDIGYLTSIDGIEWEFYADNAVLEPTFTWNTSIENSSVIFDGNTYHMWFSAEIFPDAWIGYATAPKATPEPVITSVEDIPQDQGKQVRIIWNSSSYDGIEPQKNIDFYTVWRAVGKDDNASSSAKVQNINDALHTGGRISKMGMLWDFITKVTARKFARYAYVAPTLGDVMNGDTLFSTFMITAHDTENDGIFESVPVTGFSVDNLAPGVPQGFNAGLWELGEGDSILVLLSWAKSKDEDFAYFALYKDDNPDPIIRKTELHFEDPINSLTEIHTYRLTAFDFAGNESEAAVLIFDITDIEGPIDRNVPKDFRLYQNRPNPFNPGTYISFDIPHSSPITLEIRNILGQKVITLLKGTYRPGTYQIYWNGKDGQGNVVPSGVYIYILRTEKTVLSRKMILMK